MDKNQAKEAFEKYVSNFDCTNPQIHLKIDHTYRVADISEDIASSVDKTSADLCWLIGLLHDIGRFEQLKRYGTFSNAESIDHAEFGADILFNDGLIDKFLLQPLAGMTTDQEKSIIELAIRSHNKYRPPDDLTSSQAYYCNSIRDADKIDIFRVICETPYELRMSRGVDKSMEPARDEIMDSVKSHKDVKKVPNMTTFESTIMGCAMAFGIVFERSKKIIRSQGYLKQMLSYEPESMVQKEQMNLLREELADLC